jgi:hypothetical protein
MTQLLDRLGLSRTPRSVPPPLPPRPPRRNDAGGSAITRHMPIAEGRVNIDGPPQASTTPIEPSPSYWSDFPGLPDAVCEAVTQQMERDLDPIKSFAEISRFFASNSQIGAVALAEPLVRSCYETLQRQVDPNQANAEDAAARAPNPSALDGCITHYASTYSNALDSVQRLVLRHVARALRRVCAHWNIENSGWSGPKAITQNGVTHPTDTDWLRGTAAGRDIKAGVPAYIAIAQNEVSDPKDIRYLLRRAAEREIEAGTLVAPAAIRKHGVTDPADQALLCMMAARQAIRNGDSTSEAIRQHGVVILADVQELHKITAAQVAIEQGRVPVSTAIQQHEVTNADDQEWLRMRAAGQDIRHGVLAPDAIAQSGVTDPNYANHLRRAGAFNSMRVRGLTAAEAIYQNGVTDQTDARSLRNANPR